MAGGAAMTVTPDSPLRIAQMWLITVKVTLSSIKDLHVERESSPINFAMEAVKKLEFYYLFREQDCRLKTL